MNMTLDYWKDLWKRRFSLSYIVDEDHPVGNTPATHEFRRCPYSKCHFFLHSLDTSRTNLCHNCKGVVLEPKDHKGYFERSWSRRDPHPEFTLQYNLYDPVLSLTFLLWFIIALLFFVFFDVHFFSIIALKTTSAEEWLTGDLYTGIHIVGISLLFICLFAFLFTIITKRFQKNGYVYIPPYDRTLSLLIFITPLLIYLDLFATHQPTSLFTEPYAIFDNKKSAETYFRKKVDGEIGAYIKNGNFTRAMDLVHFARAKFTTEDAYWEEYQMKIALLSLKKSVLTLENDSFRTILFKRARTNPSLSLEFWDAYLLYLSIHVRTDEYSTQCEKDPWNLISIRVIQEHPEIIEVCNKAH